MGVVEIRQVDGRNVAFRHEPGRAPTLVCIHSSADNHHSYDRLFAALPTVDRIAIDLPGRLGSEGPPLGSVTELEALVSRFADTQVDGDYVIAGHSLGGAVAIEHALASPERLKGIVLLATGARLRVHPTILQLFDQVAASGQPPPMAVPGLFEAKTDPALIAEAEENRHHTPPDCGAVDWRAADAFDRLHDVANVQVPALVVGGTNDALTPAKYAEYLAAQISNSKLVLLEGAGHMLVMERAKEVADAIETFLQSIRVPG